jgi:hypothetical protein
MNEKNIILLKKIYNSLTLISTKGEETIVMADCLRALYDIIEECDVRIETKIINLDDIKE